MNLILILFLKISLYNKSFPLDSKGIKPALESCKAAGIPVVDVDTMVDDPDLVVTQVASDCIKLGKLCGEAMAKALNGSGNIIVITTDVIRPARDRSTGFKEVMKNYPGINIVQYQDAQTCSTEDALGLMEEIRIEQLSKICCRHILI